MLRIFVAGRYNGPNVIEILENMRRGIKLGSVLMKSGYAPFVPWLDFQLGLSDEFTVDEYKAVSMEWLKASQAVCLVDNQIPSGGVLAEVRMAQSLGIPVFNSYSDLLNHTVFQSNRPVDLIVTPPDNSFFPLADGSIMDSVTASRYVKVS